MPVIDTLTKRKKMSQIKVYMSNISPLWTAQKQKEILPQGVIYEDWIKAHKRRSAKASMLVNRTEMLRPTMRIADETIYVAALPVLAFDGEDFSWVLKMAAGRRATIFVCDKKLEFKPNKQAAILHRAAKIFSAAKEETQAFERGRLGGIASGSKRRSASLEKAKLITREMWADEKYSNAELENISDLSINTLKDIYEAWGTREDAIKRTNRARNRMARK